MTEVSLPLFLLLLSRLPANANIESDPIPEQVVLLSQEIYTSDLLQILSLNLYRFEFEAKKDFTSIFNTLLRRQLGETRYPTVEYLAQKGEILLVLTKGYLFSKNIGGSSRYENHEVALNCGTCLREAFKHEQLAKIVLYSPVFWSFFDYVETGVFDVAGDAFSTFKVVSKDAKADEGTASTA